MKEYSGMEVSVHYSRSRYEIEVNGQFHAPVALSPVPAV
jgi:hypothetical protein